MSATVRSQYMYISPVDRIACVQGSHASHNTHLTIKERAQEGLRSDSFSNAPTRYIMAVTTIIAGKSDVTPECSTQYGRSNVTALAYHRSHWRP